MLKSAINEWDLGLHDSPLSEQRSVELYWWNYFSGLILLLLSIYLNRFSLSLASRKSISDFSLSIIYYFHWNPFIECLIMKCTLFVRMQKMSFFESEYTWPSVIHIQFLSLQGLEMKFKKNMNILIFVSIYSNWRTCVDNAQLGLGPRPFCPLKVITHSKLTKIIRLITFLIFILLNVTNKNN